MKLKKSTKKILKRLGVNLALELLSFIKEGGELFYTIATTPYGKLRISDMYVPKSTYYSALSSLERRGLIQKKKKGRKNIYILTPKGFKKVNTKPTDLIKRTDGFSTIVMFDIPEERGKQRTILRRYLIRNGYTQLQESVLISPYRITRELKDLWNELNLRPYITILSARIDYSIA